ncbi:MAG TPA: hypothetical protein VGH54_15735 [Mycobacterium sp.]|uniref:hypothetical protein n=1 Tax=Mycobacterium sp. TaxID=1785 RepID=UPI002F401776
MTDESAPHGRDENGEPLAPYGYLKDGKTPRKGNRGARPGQRGNGNRARSRRPGVGPKSPTDAQRKEQLCALGEMGIIAPLAAASSTPFVRSRFGQKQADALAGDAVILTQFLPDIADGLIVLAQSKPGALAWLDQVEDKAPYLLLMNVGVAIGKALVSNHLDPNPRLAKAGRLQAAMRAEMLAAAIEQQAAEMGISLSDGNEPTTVIPEQEAA